MSDQSVIHKQVFSLQTVGVLGTSLEFEVPLTAELVAIDWDTRDPTGIAFWYKFPYPEDRTTIWKLMIRGTGEPFPTDSKHLGTVVRDGFAWHIFDEEGHSVLLGIW